MPNSSKLKLLYLTKIMLEKTDPQNPITTDDIIHELSAYGINAERKAIYDDLKKLESFGIDIEKTKSKTTGYYIASRQFSLPELKLLVDAVQSSRLITHKKSEELIQKLSSLTSMAQAKQLRRQVFVSGRAKASNESVYYNVDGIHAAINDKKKITFKYFDYDLQKNRVYRKVGRPYKASPIAMIWNDDKYYLIAFCDEYKEIRHYRVDRMFEVSVLDEAAIVIEGFDIAEYDKQTFGMYGGEQVQATLCFDTSLTNVVLDKFGWDVTMKPSGDGRFDITVDISVSPVFLGWMFQLGNQASIKGPEILIEAMKSLLYNNLEMYKSK